MDLPFGDSSDGSFDDVDEFVPEHLPDPGQLLAAHDVLTGRAHARFHETTRDLFEDRGVYDVTFGYNLARLNLDQRHPDAGFRYARDADDPAVLHAEFTPTTPFCPQTETLTKGAFRAWNGERDRHDYDLVTVSVAPMHHRSDEIAADLADLAERFRETGELEPADGAGADAGGDGVSAPF